MTAPHCEYTMELDQDVNRLANLNLNEGPGPGAPCDGIDGMQKYGEGSQKAGKAIGLSGLPTETLLQIIPHIDFEEDLVLTLSLVSRRFYDIVEVHKKDLLVGVVDTQYFMARHFVPRVETFTVGQVMYLKRRTSDVDLVMALVDQITDDTKTAERNDWKELVSIGLHFFEGISEQFRNTSIAFNASLAIAMALAEDPTQCAILRFASFKLAKYLRPIFKARGLLQSKPEPSTDELVIVLEILLFHHGPRKLLSVMQCGSTDHELSDSSQCERFRDECRRARPWSTHDLPVCLGGFISASVVGHDAVQRLLRLGVVSSTVPTYILCLHFTRQELAETSRAKAVSIWREHESSQTIGQKALSEKDILAAIEETKSLGVPAHRAFQNINWSGVIAEYVCSTEKHGWIAREPAQQRLRTLQDLCEHACRLHETLLNDDE